MTILIVVLAAVAGCVVGAVFHAAIVKDVVATKTEVAGWAEELRTALGADAEIVKVKVRALILRLEAKL